MITLKLESDNMSEVFASNLGFPTEDQLTQENIDNMFSEYYDYFYDFSNYRITEYRLSVAPSLDYWL